MSSEKKQTVLDIGTALDYKNSRVIRIAIQKRYKQLFLYYLYLDNLDEKATIQ